MKISYFSFSVIVTFTDPGVLVVTEGSDNITIHLNATHTPPPVGFVAFLRIYSYTAIGTALYVHCMIGHGHLVYTLNLYVGVLWLVCTLVSPAVFHTYI